MNTYHNPQDANVRFTGDYIEYSFEDDTKKSNRIFWLITLFLTILLVMGFVMAGNASAESLSDGNEVNPDVYTIPTSLCYDSLLGMSFVIYADCNEDATTRKVTEDNAIQPVVINENEGSIPQVLIPQIADDTTVIIPLDDTIITIIEDDKPIKEKCNHGEGNGKEGCNNNTHGNNDEDNLHPSDKDKKNK